MFGIGFTELLLISVIAILFLGPDKLPETMIQIAKFIKSVKKTVGDAKNSLDEEMRIADLKEEALNYKKELDSATSKLRSFKNIDIDDILEGEKNAKKAPALDAPVPSPYAEDKVEASEKIEEPNIEKKQDEELVTFTKRSRKKKSIASDEKSDSTVKTVKEILDEKEAKNALNKSDDNKENE